MSAQFLGNSIANYSCQSVSFNMRSANSCVRQNDGEVSALQADLKKKLVNVYKVCLKCCITTKITWNSKRMSVNGECEQ